MKTSIANPRRAAAATAFAVLLLANASARAMELRVAEDQIVMSGLVEGNELRRLQLLLDENAGKITTIILKNSPGGDAWTGFRVGELIREKGLRTGVSGYCESSCSRMFLGGKERHFTDDQPAAKTWVGFHGNYDSYGVLEPPAVIGRLKDWVIKHLDGKADEALVDRWVRIANRRGFAHFFDAKRLNRPDGISVFLCQGPEARKMQDCEKIPGKDAYALGVATSSEVIKVKP